MNITGNNLATLRMFTVFPLSDKYSWLCGIEVSLHGNLHRQAVTPGAKLKVPLVAV
jgi:hypothetical protein